MASKEMLQSCWRASSCPAGNDNSSRLIYHRRVHLILLELIFFGTKKTLKSALEFAVLVHNVKGYSGGAGCG